MIIKLIKYSLICLLSIIAMCGISFLWIVSLLPSSSALDDIKKTTAQDLPYIQQTLTKKTRGKILTVVTNTDTMGNSGKQTGYELTELARAYWVFQSNGYQVDIASPKGGKAPVVIDWDDMGPYDYAFLHDKRAQNKRKNTLNIENLNPSDYQAVYFVGGKGAMFDFPDNQAIQTLIRHMHKQKKVISAVCHGPAALVNVHLDNGDWLVSNKNISAFTNQEELFLTPEAETIFPFLLQNKLSKQGAKFDAGLLYLKNTSKDGHIITGQNPWSAWAVAEQVIATLGHKPKTRKLTAEENTVNLLLDYHRRGYEETKQKMKVKKKHYDTNLIVIHAFVSAMKWQLIDAIHFLLLAHHTQ